MTNQTGTGASIIIPAYNSAERIHLPINALAAQGISPGAFEVIVVDNASRDQTAATAERIMREAGFEARGIAGRVVREDRAGLSWARTRGAEEAKFPLICFLDDDTIPCPEYIGNALAAFAVDPTVGLLISRIYPRYEVPPPAGVDRRQMFASNYRLGDAEIEWPATLSLAPTIGAGLWVKRDAFLQLTREHERESLFSDRKGESLACGGDIEIGILFGRAGYKRKYIPGLKMEHYIPRSRLQPAYVSRLIVATVRSQSTLDRRYHFGPPFWRRRLRAALDLIVLFLTLPIIVLGRKDGGWEARIIAATRWANLLGPYRGL